MSSPVSFLPEPWVEKLFATMRATYGASFDRQWECPPGADPARAARDMKRHWAEVLAPLQRSPEAIAYALENLPEFPPNLVQFRAICNRAPGPVFKALPAPPVDVAAATKVRAEVKAAIAAGKATHPKEWAVRIVERAERGEPVYAYNLRLAREALGLPTPEAEPGA